MVEQPMEIPNWAWWLIPILSAVGGAIGSTVGPYIKGYGQKKGENLATKQDIQELTRIERHWKLQRDIAVEMMRVFGSLLEKSQSVFAASLDDRRATSNPDPEQKRKASEKCDNKAMLTPAELDDLIAYLFSVRGSQ